MQITLKSIRIRKGYSKSRTWSKSLTKQHVNNTPKPLKTWKLLQTFFFGSSCVWSWCMFVMKPLTKKNQNRKKRSKIEEEKMKKFRICGENRTCIIFFSKPLRMKTFGWCFCFCVKNILVTVVVPIQFSNILR